MRWNKLAHGLQMSARLKDFVHTIMRIYVLCSSFLQKVDGRLPADEATIALFPGTYRTMRGRYACL